MTIVPPPTPAIPWQQLVTAEPALHTLAVAVLACSPPDRMPDTWFYFAARFATPLYDLMGEGPAGEAAHDHLWRLYIDRLDHVTEAMP